MRVWSFFAVSALAANLAFTISGGQPWPEPSEAEMQAAFGQFVSRLESTPNVRFTAFSKQACKPSEAGPRHRCTFIYSMELPGGAPTLLPEQATLYGSFFLDDEGQIRFETVIG